MFYSITLLKRRNPSVDPWKWAKYVHQIGLVILFSNKTPKGIFIKTVQSRPVVFVTYINGHVFVSVTDASGRYNSQFFFGNDFWLGSHTQCQELQNTRTNAIVPPFRVNFHVAVLRLALPKELTPRVSPLRCYIRPLIDLSTYIFCATHFLSYNSILQHTYQTRVSNSILPYADFTIR